MVQYIRNTRTKNKNKVIEFEAKRFVRFHRLQWSHYSQDNILYVGKMIDLLGILYKSVFNSALNTF